MSNDVDITIAGDAKEVERALEKMNAKLQKVELRLEKMRQVSQKTSRTTKDGFDQVSSSIGGIPGKIAGMVSAFASVRSAVRLIGEEWDAVKRKQEAARLATLEPAQAVREARIAFVPDQTLPDSKLDDLISSVAKETRAPVKNVAIALQTAFSAKGSLSNQVAVDAVRQALRLDPANPEQAATLAGRFLDVAKFSGSKDIQANAGFIQNVQSASRVTTSEKVGANLVPAIGGGVNFGDTPEQSAELLAAITQLMGDEEGRLSANAFLKLGGQLKDFVPQRAKTGKLKGLLTGKDPFGEFAIPDSQFDEFRKATSTKERLLAIQKAPELQRAFIGSSSFEEKSKQQALSLVRGDEKAMDELRKAEETINPIGPNQRTLFRKKIKQLDEGKLQQTLTSQQELEANKESRLLSDTVGQRISTARKTIEETLGLIDRPGIDKPLNSALLFTFDAAMRQRQEAMQKGEDFGSPERAAARALELIPRKGGLISGDMSASDSKFIDDQVEFLRRRAETLGEIRVEKKKPKVTPKGESNEVSAMGSEETNRLLKQISEKLGGVPTSTPTSQVASTTASDAQMSENNRLLQQVASTLDRIEREGNGPTIRRPDAMRLSRGEQDYG